MQAVSRKKEASSNRKLALQREKRDLEGLMQGLEEQLEDAHFQLEVGCLRHAMCISSSVTQSNSVFAGCRCVCCQY